MTYFPQKGQIYSNKITPPNPTQVVPLPSDQVQIYELLGAILIQTITYTMSDIPQRISRKWMSQGEDIYSYLFADF